MVCLVWFVAIMPRAPVSIRQVSPPVAFLRDFLLGRAHRTALRTPDCVSARTQPPPCLPIGPHYMYAENDYWARDARGEVHPPTVLQLKQDKKDESSAEDAERKLFVWAVKPESSPKYVYPDCPAPRGPCDKACRAKEDECAEKAECCEEESDECGEKSSRPKKVPCDRRKGEKVPIRTTGPFISAVRDFLLGRKHTTALRTPDVMSPRSIPAPRLPGGPHASLCRNDYHNRDARREVRPPTEIKARAKRDESEERDDSDKETETASDGPGKGTQR